MTAPSNGYGCTDAGRISRRYLNRYAANRGQRTAGGNPGRARKLSAMAVKLPWLRLIRVQHPNHP